MYQQNSIESSATTARNSKTKLFTLREKSVVRLNDCRGNRGIITFAKHLETAWNQTKYVSEKNLSHEKLSIAVYFLNNMFT